MVFVIGLGAIIMVMVIFIVIIKRSCLTVIGHHQLMDVMVILIIFIFMFMFMFNQPPDDGLPEEEEPVVPRLLIKHREHMPVPVPQAFYLERNKYRSSDRIRVLRGEGEGVSWYRND